MKKVFISRDLKSDSIFKSQLESKGFEVVSCSLVSFSALNFQVIPEVDWIFFYSKNAVAFFLKGLKKQRIPVPSAKLATLGEGTGAYLKEQGLEPDFVGSGKPEHTAHIFLEKAKGQSVLFPRAENSRQSIQQLLKSKINALDLIVYKNEPKSNFEIESCEVLVFTSPMNARTYFNKYEILDYQQVIAIGQTTEQALRNLGIEEIKVAQNPSEEALAQLILSLKSD